MRIYCVLFVSLVLVFFESLNTAKANEALLIVAKAYQNGGFNPNLIRTGIAEFERTIDRGSENRPLSGIREEMQQKEEEMIKERYKGDETRITLELERIRSSRQEARRRIVQERLKILMLGNDRTFGGEPGEKYKRRYERHEFVPSLNQWVHASIDLAFGTLFFRSGTSKSQIHVSWIPNNRDLVINDQTLAFGEFQEFGRFREVADSRVALIIRHQLDRTTFELPADFQAFSESKIQEFGLNIAITGEIEYDDGAKAKIIEVRKEDKLLEKYHIDTDRGYLCPYQYVATESGDYFNERTAKDYIVESNSELYYPTSYREVISRSGGAEKTDTQYRLVPETLRLNHPVSDAEFAIDIPEDSRVSDFRVQDNPVRYVAVKNGTVSLAKGGYDFDNMRWLVKEEALEDYVPPTGGVTGWVRWLLMGTGIILILVALYRMLWVKEH